MTFDGEAVFIGARDPRDGEWKPGAPPITARQRAFQRIWAALRERPHAKIEHAMDALRNQSLELSPIDAPTDEPHTGAPDSERLHRVWVTCPYPPLAFESDQQRESTGNPRQCRAMRKTCWSTTQQLRLSLRSFRRGVRADCQRIGFLVRVRHDGNVCHGDFTSLCTSQASGRRWGRPEFLLAARTFIGESEGGAGQEGPD